jgi:hypothetical protein
MVGNKRLPVGQQLMYARMCAFMSTDGFEFCRERRQWGRDSRQGETGAQGNQSDIGLSGHVLELVDKIVRFLLGCVDCLGECFESVMSNAQLLPFLRCNRWRAWAVPWKRTATEGFYHRATTRLITVPTAGQSPLPLRRGPLHRY